VLEAVALDHRRLAGQALRAAQQMAGEVHGRCDSRRVGSCKIRASRPAGWLAQR